MAWPGCAGLALAHAEMAELYEYESGARPVRHEAPLPLGSGGEAGEDDVEVDGLHLTSSVGLLLDRPPQRVARRLPVALPLLPQEERSQLVRVDRLELIRLRGAVAARLVRA
eukprot:scaffold8276_cov62-Phaeocystis_antarctica.AAC.13